MKILLAPDSFKGALTSTQVADRLEKAVKKFFTECEVIKIPIADGGEGTVDVLLKSCNEYKIEKQVIGPEGDEITAYYGVIYGDTAIIEMSQASGITLLKRNKNPLYTTSFGTGQLILDCIQRDFKKIYITIGGSATNDGGIGALMALGVKFFDENKNKIKDYTGISLEKIRSINSNELKNLIKDIDIKVFCDVDNTLTGENGATYVYGPQKGATGDILLRLENGMINFSKVVNSYLGKDYSNIKGAGAAGGLGFALTAFLKAVLVRGIDEVLKILKFDDAAKGCDLIITGEGCIDRQSSFGKAISGVSKAAEKYSIPVLAIGGSISEGEQEVYKCGVSAITSAVCRPISFEEAMENADVMLEAAAERTMRLIKLGMDMKNSRA